MNAARSSSPWRKTRRGPRDAREPANVLVNRTTLRHPCLPSTLIPAGSDYPKKVVEK
jgi:hypothetical protein